MTTLDPQRLTNAYEQARLELLGERVAEGHWVGQLSASALSTATAVSALAVVERQRRESGGGANSDAARAHEVLIEGGLRWLAAHQNADGGWGDTDLSYSNVATTMLVRAAFTLAGAVERHGDLLARAEANLRAQGEVAGLRRRYGRGRGR